MLKLTRQVRTSLCLPRGETQKEPMHQYMLQTQLVQFLQSKDGRCYHLTLRQLGIVLVQLWRIQTKHETVIS